MAMRDSGRLVAPAARRCCAEPGFGYVFHWRDAGATRLSDHWHIPQITHDHLKLLERVHADFLDLLGKFVDDLRHSMKLRNRDLLAADSLLLQSELNQLPQDVLTPGA